METSPRFRPRLLEGYVAREFLKIFSLSLAGFFFLYQVVDFFEKIDRLMRADLGWGEMGRYLLLKAPIALEQVISAALLLGAILTFGIFNRTREAMAIRTSGLDIVFFTRPVLFLSALTAVFILSLNLYLIPWSQGNLNLFWETQVQKKPPRSLLNLEHFWYKGDRAIYNILLYRKDVQTLEGVKIYRFDDQFRLVQVVAARQAVWQDGHWRLYQGIVQTFGPPGEEKVQTFQERSIHLTEKPQDFGGFEKKIAEMDLGELLRFVARLERDGYKSTLYRLEVQNRFAMALVPLILVMLGTGLALRQQRGYLPAMVAVGLALMFVYWLLLGFSTSLGQAGRWPVLLAVWLPHLLLGTLALVVLGGAER